jgi:glycosyltransferase involved in cell wall biosynthesis
MASAVDLSVLTPSFNYGRFMEDALLSVSGQRGLSIQHVVQDAGSLDETREVLSRFGEIDWRSEPDRGQSDALNRALARAKGRWIAWLNADEFYLPGGLARLLELGERSGADVVYGECAIVDEVGRFVRLLTEHRFSPRVLRDYGCYIASNSTIFRRAALGDSPWGEGIRVIMDWDLYMRLFGRGSRFVFTPYPVGAFRVHQAQVTAARGEHFEEENAIVRARFGHRSRDMAEWRRTLRRGRRLHRVHKTMNGAYLREWRARSMRGRDLRWFCEGEGGRAVQDLMRKCYGVRRYPGAASGSRHHGAPP